MVGVCVPSIYADDGGAHGSDQRQIPVPDVCVSIAEIIAVRSIGHNFASGNRRITDTLHMYVCIHAVRGRADGGRRDKSIWVLVVCWPK